MVGQVVHMASCAACMSSLLALEWDGTVHSVFEHSVNIAGPFGMVNLQPVNGYETPFSLIIKLSRDDFEKLDFSPGQGASCDGRHLLLNSLRISLVAGVSWDSSIRFRASRIPAGVEQSVLRKIAASAGMSDIAGALLKKFGNGSMLYKLFSERIGIADNCLLQGRFEQAMIHLGSLVGLGQGLTPSGDDFLVGLLAAFHRALPLRQEMLASLSQTLRGALTQTNDISSAFLAHAIKGEFSSGIVALLNAQDPDDAEIDRMVSTIAGYGHSSGIDTLCGIYYGLTCLKLLAI